MHDIVVDTGTDVWSRKQQHFNRSKNLERKSNTRLLPVFPQAGCSFAEARNVNDVIIAVKISADTDCVFFRHGRCFHSILTLVSFT